MKTTASILRVLVVALIGYLLLNWIGTTNETSAFQNQPWLWGLYGFIVFVHIAGEICVGALQRILYQILSPEAKKRYDKEITLKKANQFKWIKEKYKAALGSKAIEEEVDIILDHNYDGIRELDNKLPPWWVYGFYGTILFAIVYLVRFEVLNEYNQIEEYELAVAEAKIEVEKWKKTAKNLVDANTVTLLTEASDLKAGKTIFTTSCVVCHKSDGGGGIGPNLTDQYWISGGGIKNIFNTISEGGRSGKGMIAWKNELKPLERAQVASYVLSFQGTTPSEPKVAEGDLWVEDSE